MHCTDAGRRRILTASAAAALGAALPRVALAADEPLMTRPIPRSGERLPVVGIGTAIIFDFENDPARYAERRDVVRTLVAGGGKLIDTAAAYGHAEERVGDLVAELGVRDELFIVSPRSRGGHGVDAGIARAPQDRPRRSHAGMERR